MICSKCGGPIAPELADGLCPSCLISGIDSPDEFFFEETETDNQLTSLLPIPGYRVLNELARGGMGIVYRARQLKPDREVALKMLLPISASSSELRERFRQEVRTLTSLNHSAILPIYDTGEHDGLPWFSMRLATGGSLADCETRFRGRWREIATLLATLADALHFAHEHGVLHRDFKPANILFDADGHPFVADFGLAKLMLTEGGLTQSQRMMGTPNYLAPEFISQGVGEATTGSDVYSLGAVLYQLLTGSPPFEAEGLHALLRVISEEEPRFPAHSTTPEIPNDLKIITLKCLAKIPLQRYGSARELAEELRRFVAGEPIQARASSPLERLWHWSRRKPALASALAACMIFLMSGVSGIFWQLQLTESARADAEKKALDEQRQRHLADEARAHAQQSELIMRQSLYAADMPGVQRALDNHDLGTARQLLEFHRPIDDQIDLRGFEWRFFWMQAQGDDVLTLTHNGHEITALNFSPDGSLLAFGSRQVLLYDTVTFQFRARADVSSIQSFAFVPETNLMILGLRNNEVCTWDWQMQDSPPKKIFSSGRWPNVVVPQYHAGGKMALGFGDSVAGQSEGHSILYSTSTFESTGKTWIPLPESGGITSFSPNGNFLATGSWKGQIKLWNPSNGTLIKSLTNANHIVSMRFSPDERFLVACSANDSAWIYNIESGSQHPVARNHTGRVVDAEISPDGSTLATGSVDQTLRTWDLATGQQKSVYRGHSYVVQQVRWFPDGRKLASGGQDGTVRIWNTDQNPVQAKSISGQIEASFFSANGKIVGAFHPDHSVTLHQRPSLEVIHPPQQTGILLGMPPGTESLVSLQNPPQGHPEIHTWSLPSLQHLKRIILDMGTHQELATQTLRSPTLSRDGRWFAAGFGRAKAGLWDLTGKYGMRLLAASEIQAAQTMSLAFSPDSRTLAGSFLDSTVVHLWRLDDASRIELGKHKGFIRKIIYSPDGRHLVSSDGDKFIKLWDLETGKEAATLTGHREGISGLDISPDGKTLVSSSYDQTVRLWNLVTRREVARFEMKNPVQSVAFAPDGNALSITQTIGLPPTLITTFWEAPDFARTDNAIPESGKNPQGSER